MKYSVLASMALTMCTSTMIGQENSSELAADDPSAIAWYGTWASGLKAAKTSGRPILLVSAAPHCHGISGIW